MIKTCHACGDLIPEARLRAVPDTTFCVECAVRRIIADEGLAGLNELFGSSDKPGAAEDSLSDEDIESYVNELFREIEKENPIKPLSDARAMNDAVSSDEPGAAKEPAQTPKMAKRLLNVDEIELMLLTELREHRYCTSITKVTVKQVNNPAGSNWSVSGISREGYFAPYLCLKTVESIGERLKKKYDVAWRD
jgi:hypothetical protein